MSFSPWQGLAAHRLIGSIMRVRKLAYAMSARFRAQHNNVCIEEPSSFEGIFSNAFTDAASL
ncbi:MAG: hypothetical protein V4525_14340 [Pseudomonadota bacterium]